MLNTFTIDPIQYWIPGLDAKFQDPRILPSSNPYFAIQPLGDSVKPSFYRLGEMASVTKRLQGAENHYVSQCFFNREVRRKIYVELIDHAWIDLDIYNPEKSEYAKTGMVDDMQGMLAQVLEHCELHWIPLPTSVWFSGRGMYAKWAFSVPLPKAVMPRVEALNKRLAVLFRRFGADSSVAHTASVLRLPGSVNRKSGKVVEKIWQNSESGLPFGYDFGELCEEVLEYTQAQVHQFREAAAERKARQEHKVASPNTSPRGAAKALDKEDWCWGVFCDMQKIVEIRGGVKEGERDKFAFVGAVHLAHCVCADELREEISSFCGDLIGDQSWVDQKFIKGFDTTLVSKALQAARGNKVPFNGKEVDPRYRFKKDTLIELLEIQPKEMTLLKCLIDSAEKNSRRRTKRSLGSDSRYQHRREALALYESTGETSGISIRTLQSWRHTSS